MKQSIGRKSLFYTSLCLTYLMLILSQGDGQRQNLVASPPQLNSNSQVPIPNPTASYISLDGLTLVIVFNKPVNLSASIESIEQRLAAAAAAAAASVDENEEDSGESQPPGESSSSLTGAESSELRAREPQVTYANTATSATNNKLLATNTNNTSKNKKSRFSRAKVEFRKRAERKLNHQFDGSTSNTSRAALLLQAAASETSAPATVIDINRKLTQSQVCRRRDVNEGNPEDDQEDSEYLGQETPHVLGGVQLCAQLLTRKSLRLLHKYRLYNCLWATQVQFLIQLGRPIKSNTNVEPSAATQSQVKIAFRRGTLSEQGQVGARTNEQDVAVELHKLPLEGLGVPLQPRLALTGPNQVPPCGQFSLSAHLSSPYGTQPNEAVKLEWSVERLGLVAAVARPASNNATATATTTSVESQQHKQNPMVSPEALELQWQTLKQLVAFQRSNNLVLDAQLLQFHPQLYEFRLTVTFLTSLSSFTLNATHQVVRLDFDTPIGTIYGSHLLAPEAQVNTNNELALLADIQVPECAQNIKQVGLYWQVSDPRVRFEQTYGPLYLAKSNTLPEQALLEFRLNLFYGIRVKKFASAGTFVSTGDSVLESQISDGLLMASVGQPQDKLISNNLIATTSSSGGVGGDQLELFALSRLESREQQADKYTYQWSCFDGKTAQPCYKSLKVQASSGGTRYDLGSPSRTSAAGRQHLLARPEQPQHQQQNQQMVPGGGGGGQNAANGLLLVDKARQRQSILRLPLSWFDSDAQLWFGLQRFDRQQPSQHSKTEYALVSLYPLPISSGQSSPPIVSIGPVLVSRARQRATIRNPLTGAIVLLANTPAVIVGRLSPVSQGHLEHSFTWRIPNYVHPLYWTSKNVTNPLNNQQELVTELHLNPDTLLAHAHYQVQLIVCSGSVRSVASVSLDVIQGVSQCRVELMARPPSPITPVELQKSATSNLPLVITVNYCNIPLGLSPITYQLYIVDTSASDGFIESSRPATNSSSNSNADDDYINEADELFYETQAQPLTVPQLTPVFALSGLNAFALMALIQHQQRRPKNNQPMISSVRVRFGARVCNRAQSCQMFYSNSLDPIRLTQFESSTNTNQSMALALSSSGSSEQSTRQNKEHAIGALKSMLETARRANTAGNSIAAISVLNAVMSLGQRLLQQTTSGQRVARNNKYSTSGGGGGGDDDVEREGARGSGVAAAVETSDSGRQSSATTTTTRSKERENDEQVVRLRHLVQVAARDALHFGAQSIQRQFHYVDSGQTNVVLLTMSRILTLTSAGANEQLEQKYRAMRLINLLVRKSLESRLGSVASSLADFKTIQVAYESVFGTFGQHSVDSIMISAPSGGGAIDDKHQRRRSIDENNNNNNTTTTTFSISSNQRTNIDNNNNNNNSRSGNNGLDGSESDSVPSSIASIAESATQQRERRATTTTSLLTTSELNGATIGGANSPKASRRNREEAILAFLRVARAAQRSLLQAAAVQLPLGAIQQFEYQSAGGGGGGGGGGVDDNDDNNKQSSVSAKFAQQQPSANIVSSLTHQTSLLSNTIDVDLHEFGSVTVQFEAALAAKLARALSNSRLRCRHSSGTTSALQQTKCSSFVLALTSFAGKAPFRSLDSLTTSSSTSTPLGRHNQRVNHKSARQQRTAQNNAQLLRVPVIQVDWLSPVDGSSLIDLLRADSELLNDVASERLTRNDFKASVTFTVTTPDTTTTSAPPISDDKLAGTSATVHEKYRCYQFTESAGEWVEVGVASVENVGAADSSSSSSSSSPPRAQERRVKCTFDGFGVLGAFQGKPPAQADASIELSIVLGIACVLAIVTIFSLLGCVASKSREKKQHKRQLREQQQHAELDSTSSNSRGSSSFGESDYGTVADRRTAR